jgi:hypothetical protein
MLQVEQKIKIAMSVIHFRTTTYVYHTKSITSTSSEPTQNSEAIDVPRNSMQRKHALKYR